MAAETGVQFFSHLNAGCPQLTNDWGCMINLLDACLVNGVSLPAVSSATVDTNGNITVNFAATHSVLLFQCVTLAGFTPGALNGKYRVIGVPTTTQLTLSSDLSAQSATAIGTAKISPLGYQIVYSASTKRVYRALNPTAQHPYIRVDESLSSEDGTTGVYTSTYAKFAMVGLLESMDHIDDVNDPSVLQLPFDTTNPDKNWTIMGTGRNVIRGWSKWIWATNNINGGYYSEYASSGGTRSFTLIGDSDAFYLMVSPMQQYSKQLFGCGIYDSCTKHDKPWFLMSILDNNIAGSDRKIGEVAGSTILTVNTTSGTFVTISESTSNTTNIVSHTTATAITPDMYSGASDIYSKNNIAALTIPFKDSDGYLKGGLKHICYMGKAITTNGTTPVLSDLSMYVIDNARSASENISNTALGGGFYFYLGEMS